MKRKETGNFIRALKKKKKLQTKKGKPIWSDRRLFTTKFYWVGSIYVPPILLSAKLHSNTTLKSKATPKTKSTPHFDHSNSSWTFKCKWQGSKPRSHLGDSLRKPGLWLAFLLPNYLFSKVTFALQGGERAGKRLSTIFPFSYPFFFMTWRGFSWSRKIPSLIYFPSSQRPGNLERNVSSLKILESLATSHIPYPAIFLWNSFCQLVLWFQISVNFYTFCLGPLLNCSIKSP